MQHKKFLLLCVLLCTGASSWSQPLFLPLNNDLHNRYDRGLNKVGQNVHTSVKPFLYSEIKEVLSSDSLNLQFLFNPGKQGSRAWRKLRTENLLRVDTGIFYLTIDPRFQIEFGQDLVSGSSSFVNGRGVWIEGSITDKIAFASSFIETQSTFIPYLDSFTRRNLVVPGQGFVKTFYNGFDYNMASGYVSYSPSGNFNFQFGHDKNFFGDGYRSLLLSGNAFNYPFLKITTNVWKFKYVNLYTQMLHLRNPVYQNAGYYYKRKYGSFHYLSYEATKRLNIAIFEGIIWKEDDITGKRGFEINYLNPIIFFRPVEFSLGSTDNALLGMNLKYKISSKNIFYGQLVLDEFKLNEIKSGKGWYANKQAFQLGIKSFDVLGVKNLDVQTEFNFVRPYMYSHVDSEGVGNYSHYNQSLAHPLGANFYESVSFIRYRYKSIFAEIKLIHAVYGEDSAGLSFGRDIFKPYTKPAHKYGNYTGQGVRTNLFYTDIRIAYIVNAKTNLAAEAGISMRSLDTDFRKNNSNFLYFGLKSTLSSFYYDF